MHWWRIISSDTERHKSKKQKYKEDSQSEGGYSSRVKDPDYIPEDKNINNMDVKNNSGSKKKTLKVKRASGSKVGEVVYQITLENSTNTADILYFGSPQESGPI